MRPKKDNLLLMGGSKDSTIKVWMLLRDKFEHEKKIAGHKSSVTSLTSIDENSFASGSNDQSLKIWSCYLSSVNITIENVETLGESSGSINALAVLNNSYLVSASRDKLIRIYKTKALEQINESKAHSKSVQDIAVIDKNLFASCSGDHTIKIWKNSEIFKTLEGHNDYVYALEYSSENNLLISGSKDSTIRLWNISTLSLIYTMYKHTDSVISLLLLTNKTLASGSCDEKIVIWNLSTFQVKSYRAFALQNCPSVLLLN
jgi:WD40 repeat protein